MVVRIIAPRVVPYLTVILRVNVRRCRMPLLILVRTPLLSRLWLRRLSAPTLIVTRWLTSPLLVSRLLIIALLRLLLCLSRLLLPLLRRRIPHRLRPALRYMPLANSLLLPAALLLLSLLTFLLLLLLGTLLLLLLLLPASLLRIDSLSKRRHSAHHHCRKKARKHSRKLLHKLLQSQIIARLPCAKIPLAPKNLAPNLT